MSNADTQEHAHMVAGDDAVDVECDPNYCDFIEAQPVPDMAELREKLESVWGDDND